MKKYLAILLTATLLLCAAPLAGLAALDWSEICFGQILHFSAKAAEIVDSGTCGAEGDGSNLTWTLDSDGLLTISGSGEMKNYNDRESPLYNNADIKSVLIKETVTSIGDYVFSGCNELKNVAIPVTVKKIGQYAFKHCYSLICVTIPENVTEIGSGAFKICANLESVTIPGSVTRIGSYAFYGCTKLSSVSIPNHVTNIEAYTFLHCTGLTNVSIPNSVTNIEYGAFKDCSQLSGLVIPGSVKSIGMEVFSGCDNLNSIVVPASVTNIEDIIPEQSIIIGSVGSYAQQWAEENNRAFVPLGGVAVTLNAPEIVNESAVKAYGFANPGAEVVCSVKGTETITVQASANGRWNAEIPLTGAKDGDSFSVKAAVTLDGKTAEKTVNVTYKPDVIIFQEFTLTHSFYSVNLQAEKLGVAVPNITLIPGKPLAFKIKVSNNERIDKLFVVSAKDGGSKQMALTYDAASGYWFANGFFDEADKNYVPGVLTIKGTDKDGKEFDAGVTIKINFLIDPSGYAYEAVPSNKLESVTAAVYYQDQDGHELLWNAETADQLNPVTTLSDGAFAWVVPEGKWQVRLTKEGYMEARSAWMDVPPEYTDVYIAMTAEAAPAVADVNVYADRAEIVFTQYMDVNTVNTENVTFAGYAGTLKPLDAEEQGEGSGIWYAKTFSFTPEKAFSGEISVKIENAANYVGKALAEPFTAALAVAAEPKNLTAAQETTVKYGETAEITVSAENAAGKTVCVVCDSANVTLSAKTLTLDGTGKAALTVTGAMPGAANLTFTLEGTLLKTTAAVTVPLPEAAEPAFTPGDVDGNGKIESADARLALRTSVKLEPTITEGTAAYKVADYNNDGVVKSEDARAILRVSVKLDPFA